MVILLLLLAEAITGELTGRLLEARPTIEVLHLTVALEHSILVAVFHMLERGVPYADLGGDWFVRRHDLERHAWRLARQIEALGFSVTIAPERAA